MTLSRDPRSGERHRAWNTGATAVPGEGNGNVPLMDTSSVLAFGGSSKVRFKDKPALTLQAQSSWQDVMAVHADVMSFYGEITPRSVPVSEDTLPIRNADNTLTDVGVLAAADAEFYRYMPFVEKAYKQVMGDDWASPEMPWCSDDIKRSREAGIFKDPRFCSSRLFKQCFDALMGSPPWETGPKPPEGIVLFKAAGLLPADFSSGTWKDVAQSIVKLYRENGSAARAQDALAGFDLIYDAFNAWSLQKWERP